MGRPSMAAERTEQIMQATYACLRTYGLRGTTLDRVSEESGLSRSHVRHYVGNRDDLLRRFADWLYSGYEVQLAGIVSTASEGRRLTAVLDYLLGEEFVADDDDAVVRELVTAGLNDKVLRAGLQQRHEQAVRVIAQALRDELPGISARRTRDLAYGIWCLTLGNGELADIGVSEARRSTARVIADALVAAAGPA